MPAATDLSSAPSSISTSANVQMTNDPMSLLKDCVSVSMELFVRLFPDLQKAILSRTTDNKDKTHYVLVKFIGVPDFFLKFNIYKISRIDDNPGVTITNHANLVRFGPNLTFTGCVIQSIDNESIPTLERIFVHVPGVIYSILDKSPDASVKEKFICEYVSASGGVLAQGDIVRPLNGYVSLCEPFYQGRVATSTDIVFVKMGHGEQMAPECVGASSLVDETDPERGGEDTGLDLSQYLSRGMVFDAPAMETSSIAYKLQVLPLPHRISVPQAPFAAEDPELYAFMSTCDLPKLGFPVFSGDLVELYAGADNDEDESTSVIVKILTFLEPNKSFQGDAVYVSPLLLINLHLAENAHVTLQPHNPPTTSLSDAIPVAKTATISRIVSPITMDKAYQRSFFAELKSTFHTQKKCFRVGDVFPVCIDAMLARAYFDYASLLLQAAACDQPEEDEAGQDTEIVPTGNPDSVAWFKVMEIYSDTSNDNGLCAGLQFRIDPTHTSLASSGVEFVSVPPNRHNHWNEYLGMPPIFNYRQAFLQPSLVSTFMYAQEFYQVLETATHRNLHVHVLLHSMSRALGKTTLVRSAALDLGLNLIEIDAIDCVSPGADLKTIGLLTGKIEKQLAGQLDAAQCCMHHLLYIKHIEVLCAQVDANAQGALQTISLALRVVQAVQELLKKYANVVLVASTNEVDKVSYAVRQIVTFEINVPVPSEPERLAIIDFLLGVETRVSNTQDVPQMHEDRVEFTRRPDFDEFCVDTRADVKNQTLALQSAGLTPLDLASVVRKTKQAATLRLIKHAKALTVNSEKLIKVANGGTLLLIPEDFEVAINDARKQFSDNIGAPRIPNVKWADIGGLDLVKDEILDTIDLPLKHPELFNNGLKKRSGILFYGPPGTGKTLLAKAIATNFSLNFFSVKGPELLNMYIGESEANVRRVFQRARDAKPCVIFFDELDSVAPKRGNQGDSGGVMDRIVSQLLAELDGMSGGGGDGVFVVGATNRPDLLDEALLRPGRFDKMLYLGIADTTEKQTMILEALTLKFTLDSNVDLAEIAENCSFTFTGADFYALCSDAMLNAMTRTAHMADAKLNTFNEVRSQEGKEGVSSRWWFDNAATPEDVQAFVSMADFRKAHSELAPSVSAEELEHYLRVKENFEGKKKKNEEDAKNGHFAENEMCGNGNASGLDLIHGDTIVKNGN